MKILFVCLGNICRSPMADAIMLHLISQRGLADKVEVDSAGTNGYHTGEQADKRAIRTAIRNRIDLQYHRARKITSKDISEYDVIYTMADDVHYEVMRLVKRQEDLHKIKWFMDELMPGKKHSVPDPWYGDEAGFQPVFDLIYTVCEKIVKRLEMDFHH